MLNSRDKNERIIERSVAVLSVTDEDLTREERLGKVLDEVDNQGRTNEELMREARNATHLA